MIELYICIPPRIIHGKTKVLVRSCFGILYTRLVNKLMDKEELKLGINIGITEGEVDAKAGLAPGLSLGHLQKYVNERNF